jgi:hypothetical protein
VGRKKLRWFSASHSAHLSNVLGFASPAQQQTPQPGSCVHGDFCFLREFYRSGNDGVDSGIDYSSKSSKLITLAKILTSQERSHNKIDTGCWRVCGLQVMSYA